MASYVTDQTGGGIIRNTFSLYRRNFLTLFLLYCLIIAPPAVLLDIGQVYHNLWLMLLAAFLYLSAPMFAVATTTIAISDICLNNRPSISRAIGTVKRNGWPFLKTYGLLGVILLFLFLLLIVPGVIYSVRYMFVMPVMLIEKKGGMRALRRSAELTSGYFWRNLLILIIMWTIYFSLLLIAGASAGAILAMLGHTTFTGIDDSLASVFTAAFGPIMLIPVVLMYYDIRVRKENYDTTALSRELLT